jgi:hypothetical protein
VYEEINNQYSVAVLITNISTENIAIQLNNLLNNGTLYATLQQNCLKAATILNWQEEEKKLLLFYHQLFLTNNA